MPKNLFALEPNGPKRLEVSWKGMYKDMTVFLDGTELGVIPDRSALLAGREFTLPDGSTLRLQLVRSFTATEFRILRNGKPLPGSASHPLTVLKYAAVTVFFIGGLNIVLGIVSLLTHLEFLERLGLGLFSTIFGTVFLGLGFLIQKRIAVALIIAIVIFLTDAVLALIFTLTAGVSPNLSGILVRVILVIPLFPAFKAIRELKAETATGEKQPPVEKPQ